VETIWEGYGKKMLRAKSVFFGHPEFAFMVDIALFKRCFASSFHAMHRFLTPNISHHGNHMPYAASRGFSHFSPPMPLSLSDLHM
jgi:hypothetical protein